MYAFLRTEISTTNKEKWMFSVGAILFFHDSVMRTILAPQDLDSERSQIMVTVTLLLLSPRSDPACTLESLG